MAFIDGLSMKHADSARLALSQNSFLQEKGQAEPILEDRLKKYQA